VRQNSSYISIRGGERQLKGGTVEAAVDQRTAFGTQSESREKAEASGRKSESRGEGEVSNRKSESKGEAEALAGNQRAGEMQVLSRIAGRH
jgi:hypothetical protein